MARKNKMFAEDSESAAKKGIAEPDTKLAPSLDEVPSLDESSNISNDDMISKADKLAQYIEEVESLRKYKKMYEDLKAEYDTLLLTVSQLSYDNAQLQQSLDNSNVKNPAGFKPLRKTNDEPIEPNNNRKVYYNSSELKRNGFLPYRNNGYKSWK